MEILQPVIKWSGSKRSQSLAILKNIPIFRRYYEPFVGGGSLVCALMPDNGICGDICAPLINLWREIQMNHKGVHERYKACWQRMQSEGNSVFYEIRDRFNKSHDPSDLLFLSRTCVNGLIRFNKKNEFNSSLHITRNGIDPRRLKPILTAWSERLQGIVFRHGDYWETTRDIQFGDFVYLDPPYKNTKGIYYGSIDYGRLMNYLRWLNLRDIKWALSFDGKRGDVDCSAEVPQELYKQHLLLPSGNSSFNRLKNKTVPVFESLYLNY